MMRTIVAAGRYAIREERIALAKCRQNGVAVCDFEHLVARLAGGFAQPIPARVLRQAIIQALPFVTFKELEAIKFLPGFPAAACETLHRAWRADVDLAKRAHQHDRIADLAALEAEVLKRLPPNMLRPQDLAARALERIDNAAFVLGGVEIKGLTELSKAWHEVLKQLARTVKVEWHAGPRDVPDWVSTTSDITLNRTPATPVPPIVLAAATAAHEAQEAMRWARELVASGRAKPSEVAIAAASTGDYDEHFLALKQDCGFDLAFAHGVPVLSTREGQAAAALADVLVRGLSHDRIRRLSALCGKDGLFGKLPEGWTCILPSDLPLTSQGSWQIVIGSTPAEKWPKGQDGSVDLRTAIDLLARGVEAAEQCGPAFLTGKALKIWKRALLDGPAAALETTLAHARCDDGASPHDAIAFMPAYALAAHPRPYVRLVGLSSRSWPRRQVDDLLLPDFIIRSEEIEPLPIDRADERDFRTILATAKEVSITRPRRGADGRQIGRSRLLVDFTETPISRDRMPDHAFSPADRLFARPSDFHGLRESIRAHEGWRNWRRPDVTEHDGLLTAGHSALAALLARQHSATSLSTLLRDPIGYLWKYGLQLKRPKPGTEPIVLDNRAFGELTHNALDRALKQFSRSLANESDTSLDLAATAAVGAAQQAWEAKSPTPPGAVWLLTLADSHVIVLAQLKELRDLHRAYPGMVSYAEAPFGKTPHKTAVAGPWPIPAAVMIAGLDVGGVMDRIDVGSSAVFVRDFKFGKLPEVKSMQLGKGKELQRTIYSAAAHQCLAGTFEVHASLVYPRQGKTYLLRDGQASLTVLEVAIVASSATWTAGYSVPGEGSFDDYNEFLIALPANAKKGYWPRKKEAVANLLGEDARKIWSAT